MVIWCTQNVVKEGIIFTWHQQCCRQWTTKDQKQTNKAKTYKKPPPPPKPAKTTQQKTKTKTPLINNKEKRQPPITPRLRISFEHFSLILMSNFENEFHTYLHLSTSASTHILFSIASMSDSRRSFSLSTFLFSHSRTSERGKQQLWNNDDDRKK